MSLPTRALGRNGPQVSAVGLGLMSLGGIYGQTDTIEERHDFLTHACDIGERFWDAADAYLDCEDVIGGWFKKTGKRSDIFLATKFGLVRDGDTRTVRSDPEHVKAACAKSLQRLGVETIDLYYCHRVDDKTPIEKTVEAMAELKKEGKIRYLGLSECSANTIRRAHAVHPIAAYQVEYSLFCLDIEKPESNILKTCRELGIAVIAYSPIGRGLLSGQIKSFDDFPANDFRRLLPQYQQENFPKILEALAKVESIAKKYNATASQVCIAWVQAQGEDIISIPGTRTIKYLDQNTRSAEIKLADDDVKELRRFAEAMTLPGPRYPHGMMGAVMRDSVPL